jgi:hypothetical protein
VSADRGQAADVLLARRLCGVSGSPPRVSLWGAGRVRIHGFDSSESSADPDVSEDGAVEMLAALGSLSPEAAADWRARFALAGHGWRPATHVGGPVGASAESFLASLVERLEATRGTGERLALVNQINAAFGLFLYVGLVLPDDAETWGRRVGNVLGTVEAFDDFDDFDDLGEPDRGGGGGPGTLLAVAPAEPARHDGLCITAAEIYEHGVTVHWHLLLDGPGGVDELLDDELVITDDVGTDYGELSGGGAHWSERAEGPYAVTGETRRSTPVAAGAGELRVSRGAATWRIPLTP